MPEGYYREGERGGEREKEMFLWANGSKEHCYQEWNEHRKVVLILFGSCKTGFDWPVLPVERHTTLDTSSTQGERFLIDVIVFSRAGRIKGTFYLFSVSVVFAFLRHTNSNWGFAIVWCHYILIGFAIALFILIEEYGIIKTRLTMAFSWVAYSSDGKLAS